MSYAVAFSAEAREDLKRMYEHLLARATTIEELFRADGALNEIESAVGVLESHPLIYRKVGEDPLLRELLVPFGKSGYVLLYRIVDAGHVLVTAVRHQLEDDYH